MKCAHCGGGLIKEYGEVSCLACGRSPGQSVVTPSPEKFRCGHPKTLENMVIRHHSGNPSESCRTCEVKAGKLGQVKRNTVRGTSPQITPSDRRTRVA